MTKLVVNASPIISLSAIDRIDILLQQANVLIITKGVCDEITAHPDKTDPAIKWINELPLFHVVPVDLKIAAWDLGKGENEVLSFCLNNEGHIAVIDDLAARKCAAAFGIKAIGTISLILSAKNLNIIPSVKPILVLLRNNGFRIKDELFATCLKIAKED